MGKAPRSPLRAGLGDVEAAVCHLLEPNVGDGQHEGHTLRRLSAQTSTLALPTLASGLVSTALSLEACPGPPQRPSLWPCPRLSRKPQAALSSRAESHQG